MQDNMNFSGYFKIESFDKNNNLIDYYEDKNLIMTSARTSMSEIFGNLNTSTSINRISLGTMGHVGVDTTIPKGPVDGFVPDRDRMFSEPGSTQASPTNIGDVLPTLLINEILYINSVTGTPGFYRYIKTDTTNYTVTELLVSDVLEWEFLGATAPYTYNLGFTLPGTNIDTVLGDPCTGITETDVGAGSTVNAFQSGTSMTFNAEFAGPAGNSQGATFSTFTEAALYANNRIFSLKTFKGKIKDTTVVIRITWTITF